MILPITVYGHPVLRKVASEVDSTYEDLPRLLENLWETMYHADGVGLAAPQVGIPLRVFVIDGEGLAQDFPELEGFKKAFINARLTLLDSPSLTAEEGCISIPGIREEVARPSAVKINYVNEQFEPLEEIYTGFAARIIQHEYDHLEGRFFTDYLSPLRKRLLKGKLNAIKSGKVNVNYAIKLP